MSDISERVKKIVVEHLGVEAELRSFFIGKDNKTNIENSSRKER